MILGYKGSPRLPVLDLMNALAVSLAAHPARKAHLHGHSAGYDGDAQSRGQTVPAVPPPGSQGVSQRDESPSQRIERGQLLGHW